MIQNCTFCDIVQGKIDGKIVYQDKDVTCFLDKSPINEGHLLLVPNEHYLDIDDMPDTLVRHISVISKKMVMALKEAYNADGYSIMQNGGAFNDIGHYHMHIFPRYCEDNFGWVFENNVLYSKEKTCQKIIDALNK
ncbi:MAG: HIT family protein [Clostridia bacterium]